MGLFSRKKPRSWLGRYIIHIGGFGLLALLFGAVLTSMLIGDIKNLVTLRSVDAAVVSTRAECELFWTETGDRRSRMAESCDEAETLRDESTERLYRVEQSNFATVEWTASDGQSYRAELDKIDTKSFRNPQPGETVTVLARGGDTPKAAAPEGTKDFTITLALLAFCIWMAWPPPKPGKERVPFIYVKRIKGKGFFGSIFAGLHNMIAGWAFYGAVLGAFVACYGGYMFLTAPKADIFVAGEARVVDIEKSCRLSPSNGNIIKLEATQKISCDRARAIAENRPEENYRILDRVAYTLRYTDKSGTEHDEIVSGTRMDDLAPAIDDTVPIEIAEKDPTRMRIFKERNAEDDGMSLDKMLMVYGTLFALLCCLFAWLLGVGINWARIARIGRRA